LAPLVARNKYVKLPSFFLDVKITFGFFVGYFAVILVDVERCCNPVSFVDLGVLEGLVEDVGTLVESRAVVVVCDSILTVR
jgi:hypothetical protein